MDSVLRKYLSKIGRRGGLKSKRVLKPESARAMVKLREARRAFKLYKAKCFWSYAKGYRVTAGDIPWVADQLRKNGDLEAWKFAERLCR